MNKEDDRQAQEIRINPIVIYGILRGGTYLSSLNYMTLDEAERSLNAGDALITFVEKLDD